MLVCSCPASVGRRQDTMILEASRDHQIGRNDSNRHDWDSARPSSEGETRHKSDSLLRNGPASSRGDPGLPSAMGSNSYETIFR